jgi:transposase InsO family protein
LETVICAGFLAVGGLESGGDRWLLVLVLVFGGGEHVQRAVASSGAELRTDVFDYIEIFYNATRRHSTLGMLSPQPVREDQFSTSNED